MARTLTPKDAHNLINMLVEQMTGKTDIQATDTSSFVSAGELVMSYGVENVLNALTLVLGRTMVASRKYTSEFVSINAINTGVYSHRLRKISFYSQEALPSGNFNTDLHTNAKSGFDNGSNGGASTPSMWEQHLPKPLEMNFAGSSVWDDCITRKRDAINQAFRDESEFNAFVSGFVQEKGNDIERQKEAFSRMTVCNYLAGLYIAESEFHNGMAVNMTEEFNTKFGTSYTTEQLKTTYLEDFLKFFTSYIKKLKKRFKNSDTLNHWSVPLIEGTAPNQKVYHILRHTPADRFRGLFNSEFFIDAEAYVFPTVFNEKYLDDGKGYELVTYWQSIKTPMGIDIEPAIPDFAGTNSGMQTKGSEVKIDTVLGVCFDADALMIDFELDSADATPLEARKKYYSIWYSIARNSVVDYTERACMLYMADPVDDSGSKLGVNS